MSRFTKLTYAALAITLVTAGCTEQPPRSFVQPNVIKKADLDGTWYYLQTVVDAPPTSSFMFIGNSSELMKIKFDIEESTLFARRSYEQIQGSEDAYTQDPAQYNGQPVAAWPISSQFDIIRDYNSTTGEETNKIIESTERPWNEREFIRVDWSQNLLTDSDVVGLGINFFFSDEKVESASYWESDPTKPDAFHLERADATDAPEFAPGEANYMDITNKWVVTPTQETVSYEENGVTQYFTVPACFLGYKVDDCASQVVKVRHSFAKISPKHDYQPRNWDGKQMNLFGIWDVGLNRLTYNRQYGVTNSGFVRHAARFNLWKKSYMDDGKTPIPYNQRELRTIPYYAESSLEPFPPELFATGQEIIRQWNAAVSTAVTDVTGAAPTQDIFVWCHNPVKLRDDMGATCDPTAAGYDPAMCKDPAACQANIKAEVDATGAIIKDSNGDPIYHARQGDPRRSNIFWVNQEQDAGPLGYGPPLFDVETGETISGQAYIYGAALDTYAAYARDLVLLATGKIDPQDYIVGANVDSWVQANRAGVTNQPKLTDDSKIMQESKAMDFSWARGQAPQAPIVMNGDAQTFLNSLNNRETAMYAGGIFGQNNADQSQILRDHLRGSQLEGMMITPDIMTTVGAAPGTDWTSLSDAEKMRVSPLRSQAVSNAINARLDKMRAFGYDFADFADEGVIQEALRLAHDPSVPNMDPEAIRQKLRKDIFLAVTLHEVGHNMGLRHNFRASFDALNYFPQYWTLRAGAANNAGGMMYDHYDPATGQAVGKPYGTTYTGVDSNGNPVTQNCVKGTLYPRYINCAGGATSVDEINGAVRDYQYSSIMDYGANFNSDLQGLGAYDKAAMKFSYAGDGFVEVFTDAKPDNATAEKFASLHQFQNAFGFPAAFDAFKTNLVAINYEQFPDLFNSGADGLQKRSDVPYSTITTAFSGYEYVDANGNPMVPYYFCSDEFVGNLTCQRFDSGADAYEQAQDLISRYNNWYIINDFKRDRYTFHTSLSYKDRISSRYLDILQQQLQWYTLLRADFADFATNTPQFFADSVNGWGSFTHAVTDGFNLLGQILSRPGAGTYSYVAANATPDYPIGYYAHSSDSLAASGGLGAPAGKIVDLIDGRYIDTTWDFDGCGYYWADECQTRIGYFYDKTAALDVLTQSQAYFTGRDTSTDVRKYAIGYILPYRKQIEERIGGLLAGDYVSFAPRLNPDNTVQIDNWATDQVARGTTPGNIIDPAGGFTLQLYAGVYGLSTFPTTFDHSFIDTTNIFVVGNGEASVPDSTIMTATNNCDGVTATNGWFCVTDNNTQDQSTGKMYAAKVFPIVSDGQTPTPVTYNPSVGERMLQTFQSIIANANTVCAGAGASSAACAAKQLAVTQFRENLDVMRSLHAAYGYGVYKSDTPFLY